MLWTSIVELYLPSTSNHNDTVIPIVENLVELYLLSTSNHNISVTSVDADTLSYIFFLHQTTTCHIL